MRDFGRIAASFWQRGQFSFSIGCKSKAGPDVLTGEIGKLFQEIFLCHPAGKVFQDVCDCHPCPANARLAASLSGFDGYDLLIVHTRILPQSREDKAEPRGEDRIDPPKGSKYVAKAGPGSELTEPCLGVHTAFPLFSGGSSLERSLGTDRDRGPV